MDRRRAAAALLALAACIACSSAAPTASNQTALELHEGPTEGCYYNFQHYGEGDRIMTNEPCLNCTCHNRMLMCYLRVCPFTKPIGQDCTVEKRADQCCPIVTCPDVPVDLLTSTSTSSPAEYGSTGVGKYDKYGCSINGKYFSEGSKVPSTPNKPCEHCYCIRNMTTCVMQECTLHVDGCTPIYHKEVCCPVRYSCDHPEDEILLLDDMTTTVRPTPGFLLTTTTIMPVTQMTQDCVHDDQIFPDGALIKTEKACEHCYCMKGDIVCVVQECGTPMENEGKNCTSLPPRHGQCCPDTYICDGDDRRPEITTEIDDHPTTPPRRAGVEGSGYRNEPDESFTEINPYETDLEGSGEDYATASPIGTDEAIIPEKVSPDIFDELLATTDKGQTSLSTEPDKGQNTIPDIFSEKDGSGPLTHDITTHATEQDVVFTTSSESSITTSDVIKPVDGLVSKDEEFITTESAFRKEDNNIIPDEILTIKEAEKLSTLIDVIDTTTSKYEHSIGESTDYNLPSEQYSTTQTIEHIPEDADIKQIEKDSENKSQLSTTESIRFEEESPKTSEEELFSGTTAKIIEKTDLPETTSINPVINEVDENISPPGRIPGEGDCLLNGITYANNTIVPSTNNCHTSCKCTSSIIKCDPIICSPPPEYVENMNDCQPIYDSPDACCPTYVCSGKETIPPQSHSQMSGTEIPKTSSASDCDGEECALDERQKPIQDVPPSGCTSDDCLNKHIEKQEQSDCGSNDCTHIDHSQTPPVEQSQGCSDNECQVSPVVACEGDKCLTVPVIDSDSHKTPVLEGVPTTICDEKVGCKKPKDTEPEECKDEICKRKDTHQVEVKLPSECSGSECKADIPITPTLEQEQKQFTESITEEIIKDKVTESSFNELDTKYTVTPESSISTLVHEHVTENIGDVTKKVEQYTESSEEITTVSNIPSVLHTTGDQSDRTVSPTVPEEFEEDLRNAEKEETKSTEVTEQTSFEDKTFTKYPGLQDNKDLITETILIEQTTQREKFLDETSESTKTKSEELFTEKIEITTDKMNVYTDDNKDVTKHEDISTKVPVVPEVPEIDKTHTKVPEMHYTDLEKSTEPEHFLGSTEKEITFEDITEISQTEKEQPTLSDIEETVTQQIETSSKEPTSQFVETHTELTPEKGTKQQEPDEPYEIITDKTSGEIYYVTPHPASHITKDETINDIGMITESNIIPTEIPQPALTKKDEVTKEISQESVTEQKEIYTESNIMYTETPQSMGTKIEENIEKEDIEIITEKQEIVTESSEYYTKQPVEVYDDGQKITTVKPVYHTDSQATTEIKQEVPDETMTEKKTPYTESPLTLQTEINEISQEFGTEKETKPETFEHLSTKIVETVTDSIIEKQTDSSVIEEESTKIFEIDTPTKEETYTEYPKRESTKAFESETSIKEDTYTETPKIYITPSEEFITEEYDKHQNIITELPEIHKTSIPEISTTTKDILDNISKDLEKPIASEKESAVTDEAHYTTSETAKISEHFTEKDVVPTEFTPSQELKEDLDVVQATSSVPLGEDKQDLEYQKITTAVPDIVAVQETTIALQDLIEITESETETPIRIDEKPEEVLTELPERLPSKSDDISTKPYETVTSKINIVETEDTLHEDYSTKSPVFDEKHDLDVGKPQDVTEEIIEVTTISSVSESEITSQDLEKTTDHLVSHEEKEPSYTTEIITDIEKKDTHEQVTTSVTTTDDDRIQRTTTEKSTFVEEHLPQPSHEYIPVEAISDEVATQTEQHIPTEKIQIPDIYETNEPTSITTKQPGEFTKLEEPGTSILDKGENEIITDLPGSYTLSPDLHEISTLVQSEISSEDNKKVTETPMSLITHKELVTTPGVSVSSKDQTELDLTTKKFSDQTTEVAKEQTITSKEFTTEQQPLPTEVPKEIHTQRQEIDTDKFITTGVSEFTTSSYVYETTLSSLKEEVKDKLEITTENQLHQKESEVKPSPDLSIQNTEGTPVEEDTSSTDEQKTTSKPSGFDEQLAPHISDYQTTILIDEIQTDEPHKEITTISPKLELEEDVIKVTEIIETVEHELTTQHSPLDRHETVSGEMESETSPETFETEPFLVATTEDIKPSVTDQNEATVAYPSIETLNKDDAAATITESVEIIQTDEPTAMITESIEPARTDKPTEKITESREAVNTNKPTEMITDSIKTVHTDKPTDMITESIESVHTDTPTEIITESIEAVHKDTPTEMTTESIEALHTDKPTEIITELIEAAHTNKPIEIITESIETDRTDKPTDIITETIEEVHTNKPTEIISESIGAVQTDKPTEIITESIEAVKTDKPTEIITDSIEAVHTDMPTEMITESIEAMRTDKPTEIITESIESFHTDKPTEIITEMIKADHTDKPTDIITESIEAIQTDKPSEFITESIQAVHTDKPTEFVTESIEAVHTYKPTEIITESIKDDHTDKPTEITTEYLEPVVRDEARKTTEIPSYTEIEISTAVSQEMTDKHEHEDVEAVSLKESIATTESQYVTVGVQDESSRKTTEIPSYTEIETSTAVSQGMTEKHEHEDVEAVSLKESIATTESQYVTVGVRDESNTEGLHISTKEPDQMITNVDKLVSPGLEVTEISGTKEDSETEKVQLTNVSSYPETTDLNVENQTQLIDEVITPDTKAEEEDHTMVDKAIAKDTTTPGISYTEISASSTKQELPDVVEENFPTTESQQKYSETTPFLVELEQHTHHVIDEITTQAPLEEIATTMTLESQQTERGDQIPDDFVTYKDEYQTSEPSKTIAQVLEVEGKPEKPVKIHVDENTLATTETETEISEKIPEPTPTYTMLDDINKQGSTSHDEKLSTTTVSQISQEKEYTTESTEIKQTSQLDVQPTTEKDIHIESDKPSQPEISEEKLTSETAKETTSKISEETSTYSPSIIDKVTKPEEKPIDTTLTHSVPEVPKPGFIDEPIEEVPPPDFSPSGTGGYGQETDYVDEDQAFGPGTCRYGGKVYVSAQQIPRDDPCDFCFCFRSDIICLQQSCPPPIHGCHEEPIQGFCCPRYECPVSMATTLNVTTTTTTTTTTLPPHFLPHAYKGAAQRRGCQIKGHTYKVGEVVRASSGPCLHCTCGGDGQMKCDPKACTPEPMLRQMIAAAVSAKRRR